MATLLEQPFDSGKMPPYPVRRWTVAEYRHLDEIGGLTEDDDVELLEGWIVPKKTKGPEHEWVVSQLRGLLSQALGDEWLLRIQCAINTADSEPEPDVSIVRAPNDRYLKRYPTGPDEIPLVIEVADSSLARDRRKADLYAADGLAACIIINLVDDQVEFYTEPDSNQRRYQRRRILHRGERLSLIVDNQTLAEFPVENVLPPQD